MKEYFTLHRMLNLANNYANSKIRQYKIQDKLMKELPGILNWSLAGLKALRERNGFTNTTDQETLIRELEMINDPISAFIDEVVSVSPESFSPMQDRQLVYAKYQKWCDDTNTVPISSRWFRPRMRQKVYLTENRDCTTRKVSIKLKR